MSLEAPQGLWPQPSGSSPRGLDSLVSKSLSSSDDSGREPRFSMLETIREYAARGTRCERDEAPIVHMALSLPSGPGESGDPNSRAEQGECSPSLSRTRHFGPRWTGVVLRRPLGKQRSNWLEPSHGSGSCVVTLARAVDGLRVACPNIRRLPLRYAPRPSMAPGIWRGHREISSALRCCTRRPSDSFATSGDIGGVAFTLGRLGHIPQSGVTIIALRSSSKRAFRCFGGRRRLGHSQRSLLARVRGLCARTHTSGESALRGGTVALSHHRRPEGHGLPASGLGPCSEQTGRHRGRDDSSEGERELVQSSGRQARHHLVAAQSGGGCTCSRGFPRGRCLLQRRSGLTSADGE